MDINQTIEDSLLGIFLNKILQLYTNLISHDVGITRFQIFEILKNEGFEYTKDIHQLETSLDAKEHHWICKWKTLAPRG